MTKERSKILFTLKDKVYDVVIVGGGVIGAHIALAAAKDGIKTLLLDKHDFCYGSSSKTSKILSGSFIDMHRNTIFETMRTIRERNRIIKKSSSPSLPIILPLYEYGKYTFWRQEIRVQIYEILSLLHPRNRHKILQKEELLKYFPSLVSSDITGAIEYYEAKLDDTRYTIETILAAENFGADAINYSEVTAFDYNEKEIKRVIVADTLNRKVYEVKAKNIVISAGAWTEDLCSFFPYVGYQSKKHYVKGTHLFINTNFIEAKKSLILPSTNKTKNIYLLPWKGDTVILGTTNKNYNGQKDCIYAASDEVEYLLDFYNTYFNTPVNKQNIITTQSGLYPDNIHNFSVNKHPVFNLFNVDGGSFTMCSYIASTVLSKIYPVLKRWKTPRCVMHKESSRSEWVLSEYVIKFLCEYFGYTDIAERVDDFCKEDSSLLKPVANDKRIPRGLIHYFVKKEHAIHLEDIMVRRLRFIITEEDCGTLIAEQIAEEMAQVLNWSDKVKEWEIKRYRTEIKRNRISLF